MVFLKALFIVVEVLSCLLLIGLVLLQKSKSEGLGLAFGAGAGESLFGARAGNVLSKATVVLGIVFMANTLLLGILFAQKEKTLMDSAPAPVAQPTAMQTQPVDALDLVIPSQQSAGSTGAAGAFVDPDVAEAEAGAAEAVAEGAVAKAEVAVAKAADGSPKADARADESVEVAEEAIADAMKADKRAEAAAEQQDEM